MAPTLYQQIYDHYKQLIISGELSSHARLPSERDIAIEFGVSRITVTRALKELESEKFIERIQGSGSFVTESEWVKITSDEDRLDIISLVLPFQDDFSLQILNGVEAIAKKNRFFVTFHNSKNNSQCEREILQELIGKGSKGIILYPIQPYCNMDLYTTIVIQKIPFVLIDRTIPGLDLPIVSVDNQQSFKEITQYLLNLGHTKMILVAPEIDHVSSEFERYTGFCQAHIDASIPLMQKHLYTNEDLAQIPPTYRNDKKEDLDHKAMHFLFDLLEKMALDNKPSAIMAINDEIAALILSIALERNLKVPEAFSLTGFDNMSYSSRLSVPLTTIAQPANEIGTLAAFNLFKLISNFSNDLEKEKVLGRLIIRKSTLPPNSDKY